MDSLHSSGGTYTPTVDRIFYPELLVSATVESILGHLESEGITIRIQNLTPNFGPVEIPVRHITEEGEFYTMFGEVCEQ